MIGPLCPNCLDPLRLRHWSATDGNTLFCDQCQTQYLERTVHDLLRQRVRTAESVLRELVEAGGDWQDTARYTLALKQARAVLRVEEQEG